MMSQNPAGSLLVRDELTGWLSRLDLEENGPERSFALQAWNGDSDYTIDRIGRGTIHVPACCMSILGGIQPGRLRSYLAETLRDGPGNDGLMQRFQLSVWPDMPSNWEYVDRAPDPVAEQRVRHVFRELTRLDSAQPLRFRFAPDAQELFIDWLTELEAKLRSNELHPALISHLSKYRSLMPSLATLFELADLASIEGFDGASLAKKINFVCLDHTRQAAAYCDYLESHARRIYSCVTTPQMRTAQELAGKIKARKVGADGFFTTREVYLKGWSGLDTPESVKLAVEVLKDAGWIREASSEPGPSGGRPPIRYAVNPKLWP
jgi:putative DNA primase/helicase